MTVRAGTTTGHERHHICENLCNIMLEGAGFTVIDVGVHVPPARLIEEVEKHTPDVAGFSAFRTTTMPMFKATICAPERAGFRDPMAPVTRAYVDAVGADGYPADTSSAGKRAKGLIERDHGLVAL